MLPGTVNLFPCPPGPLCRNTPFPFAAWGRCRSRTFTKASCILVCRLFNAAACVGQWQFVAAWRPVASAAVLGNCGQPCTPVVTCAVGIYFGALLVLYLLYSLPMSYIKVGWGRGEEACCCS